jgi:Cysteine-rich CWC
MADEVRADAARKRTTSEVTAAPLPHLVCPICEDANGCVPATCGTFDAPCWCRGVSFNAAALASLPVREDGPSCVCAACAAKVAAPALSATLVTAG